MAGKKYQAEFDGRLGPGGWTPSPPRWLLAPAIEAALKRVSGRRDATVQPRSAGGAPTYEPRHLQTHLLTRLLRLPREHADVGRRFGTQPTLLLRRRCEDEQAPCRLLNVPARRVAGRELVLAAVRLAVSQR
jgi:hypothetical protein